MIPSQARVLVALIIILILVVSCSGDDPAAPPTNGGNGGPPPNTPPIPLPQDPNDALPERSDSLIMETSDLANFSPFHNGCPPAIEAKYPGMWVYLDPYNQRPSLVTDSVIIDPVTFRIRVCNHPSCMAYVTANESVPGIGDAPKIQYIRYWKKIFSVVIQYPTTYRESHTYTEGTSETHGETFAYSIGVSASGWGLGLSAEFSRTFSHEITVYSESSVTKEYSASSIEGKTLVFTAWQLVDGFSIVDETGATYSDPGYKLNAPVLDHATNLVYLSVVQFDS